MNRETRIGVALVLGLGLFVYFMLTVGSLGGVRPDLTEYSVGEILAEQYPAVRHGSAELRIVGWYAELSDDCVGDSGNNTFPAPPPPGGCDGAIPPAPPAPPAT